MWRRAITKGIIYYIQIVKVLHHIGGERVSREIDEIRLSPSLINH